MRKVAMGADLCPKITSRDPAVTGHIGIDECAICFWNNLGGVSNNASGPSCALKYAKVERARQAMKESCPSSCAHGPLLATSTRQTLPCYFQRHARVPHPRFSRLSDC